MRVLNIINPASGKEKPILSALNTFYRDNGIKWDLLITENERPKQTNYDYIVIYGGDGTITKYLSDYDMPMLPLQGGTANLIAKEIGIPKNISDALELLKKPKVSTFDAFLANDVICYIRAYAGGITKSVKQVSREQKNKMGIAAYLEAIINEKNLEKVEFEITINSKKHKTLTNILLICNMSALGLGEIKLDKQINGQDGKLDILSISEASILGQNEHQQFTHAIIKTSKEIMWSVDDNFIKTKEMVFKILPDRIKLITP